MVKSKSTINNGKIYVDNDAPLGGDGSQEHPYKTIGEAVSAVVGEHVTVIVYNGTYYENVVIDKEGLILKGAGEDKFGNDSDGAIIDGQEKDDVVDISADDVTINGFTIQNSSKASDKQGIRISGTEGHIIINNYFNDNSRGIYCTDSSDVIIDNNVLIDTKNRGIFCRSSDTITISNNSIDDAGNDTIYCTNSDIITIENNIEDFE